MQSNEISKNSSSCTSKKIDLIVFDNDGVMFEDTPVFQNHCFSVATQVAMDLVPLLTEKQARQMALASRKKHKTYYEAFTACGISLTELHRSYHNRLQEENVLSRGDLPALFSTLNIPCAMLTHGNRSWATRVLNTLGIKNYFPDESIFTLEEIGFQRKSDSIAPFTYVLSQMKASAARTIMVDDTPENLFYSKKCGMWTALIVDNKRERTGYPFVDVVVAGLPSFLSAANKGGSLGELCGRLSAGRCLTFSNPMFG